jgi:hypothetical protein
MHLPLLWIPTTDPGREDEYAEEMQDECFAAKHSTLAPSIVKMSPSDLGQGLLPAAARSDRLQSKRAAFAGLLKIPYQNPVSPLDIPTA